MNYYIPKNSGWITYLFSGIRDGLFPIPIPRNKGCTWIEVTNCPQGKIQKFNSKNLLRTVLLFDVYSVTSSI